MKKFLTATMALAILGSAGAASAQPYNGGRNDDRRDDRRTEQRYDRQDDRRVDRAERRYDNHVRKAERRYRAASYRQPSGYRYHQWNRGERLPAAYRGTAYRVDHRTYRLPPPPRGYYYTRVDNDVLLTAATTGLIASVVANIFQ